MYCVKCGTANPDGASFCLQCGTKLFVLNEERTGFREAAAPADPEGPAPAETSAAGPAVPQPAAFAGQPAAPQPAVYAEQPSAPQQTVYAEQSAAPQPAAYAEQPAVPQPAAYAEPAAPQSAPQRTAQPVYTVAVSEGPIDESALPPVINRVRTIRRKWNFETIIETFHARNASYENVKTVLRHVDFSSFRVELRLFDDEKAFGFIGGDWGATLTHKGVRDGVHDLRFKFVRWKSAARGMNETVTAIEQALLLIDPDTTYEEKYAKVNTKTSFF